MGADRKPEFFAGKDIRIGIIGCGYVGLPLALRFAETGQRVTGFDTDPIENGEAERREKLHPAHPRGQNCRARESRPLRRHHRFHQAARDGCGADLRAYAAR